MEDDSVQREIIEIDSPQLAGESIQEIRGSYTMTLPQYKRIQLEIGCELPFENESDTLDEYYVEVFERNQADKSEWIQMGTLKQKDEMSITKSNIFRKTDEKFALVSYAVNLTQWAGREIRLDLVSHLQSKTNEINKGRWTSLRLVGSSFDFKLVDFESHKEGNSTISFTKKEKKSSNRMLYTPVTSTGYLSYVFTDLDFYADCGPAPVYINNRWISYFVSGYKWNFWPCSIIENGKAHGGSLVFDLTNYSTYTLWSLIPDVANNSILRIISGTPTPSSNTTYKPYTAIESYRPSNPMAVPMNWKYNWDNGYVGVNSAFVATSGNSTRVHAFLHVEDWYKNINAVDFTSSTTAGLNYYNTDLYKYGRIGYARSANGQGYPLALQPCSGDVSTASLNNASPIIEGFQKESDHPGIGMFGVAVPAAIIDNSGERV